MPIDIGTNKIGKINAGSSAIGKVYKGSDSVYQSAPKYYCYHEDRTPYAYIYINELITTPGTYQLYSCSDASKAANSSSELVVMGTYNILSLDSTGINVELEAPWVGKFTMHFTRYIQNDLYS